ncbi:hypothetical protein BB558_000351 [Smittium angustum]|uniref:FAD-binding FR-type domain-containing protein n=1 Tax=Smittium angustum TaxID=133377 RepID=A0A2U1JEF4_SMIAN|nr:hypothetical protein BB558_000351 [Smittium angustum]
MFRNSGMTLLTTVVATGSAIGLYNHFQKDKNSSSVDPSTIKECSHFKNQKRFGGPKPPRKYTLSSIQDVSPDTKRLRFTIPSNTNVNETHKNVNTESEFQIAPIGIVIGVIPPFTKGVFPVIRPYTPIECGSIDGHDYMDLIIKKNTFGKTSMSAHLHDLEVGETMRFGGPINTFDYSKISDSYEACAFGEEKTIQKSRK